MSFPDPHIISPLLGHPHTHTAILLHGRGSSGPEFAEDLFSMNTSTDKGLAASLPSWRWVFPSAKTVWSEMWQEEMGMWFEACREDEDNDDEGEKKKRVQAEGLREAVGFVKRVLEEEVERAGGDARRVVLGGISQGMATGLWALLGLGSDRRVGGFLGMCGWLPFAKEIENGGEKEVLKRITDGDTSMADVDTGVPVLLVHGTDDVWVSVGLGRQARKVLEGTGMSVGWLEFTRAENDGHWVKQPEGYDSILQFFEKIAR